MSKNTFKQRFFALASGIVLALSLLALTINGVALAADTLTLNVNGVQQVYLEPRGEAIFNDVVSGAQTFDMFAVVDVQGDGNETNDEVWLRIGSGTDYHARADSERWLPYGAIEANHLADVYTLPKMKLALENREEGQVLMRTVERKVLVDFEPTASATFVVTSSGIPQVLIDVRLPYQAAGYHTGGTAAGDVCEGTLNGIWFRSDNATSFDFNGGRLVLRDGKCSLWGATTKKIAIERSFSARYLQAGFEMNPWAVLILIAIAAGVAIYNRRRFAPAYAYVRKSRFGLLPIVFAILLGVSLLASPVLIAVAATPPPPKGTAVPGTTPTATPAATEVPTVEPTAEVTEEAIEEPPFLLGARIDENGHLLTEWSFAEIRDLGKVTGEDGRGIQSAALNEAGELVLTYTDGTQANVGRVKGTDGMTPNDQQIVNACLASQTCVDTIANRVLELQNAQATAVPLETNTPTPAAPLAIDWLLLGGLCFLTVLLLAAIALVIIAIRRRRPATPLEVEEEEPATPASPFANATPRRVVGDDDGA